MASDSVSDVEQKLSRYRGQLAQLDALLATDSSNADLQKLRGDLRKAIALTEDVLKTKRAKIAEEKIAAAAAVPVETSSGWTTGTGTDSVPISSGGSSAASLANADVLSLTGGKGRFAEGAKVEGPFPTADGRTLWFPGVIVTSHGGGTSTVRFIGVPGGGSWADGAVVEESTLRPLYLHANAPPLAEMKPGYKVLAKYSGDGGWWPAVVDDITGNDHIRITFQGYSNTEIVPREYIQKGKVAKEGAAGQAGAAAAVALAEGASEGSRPGAAGGADGVASSSTKEEEKEDAEDAAAEKAGLYAGLVIPDNLRLQPTDTAEERARKRKKVKALKLAWKQRKQEEQSASRATSWQAFVSKAGVGEKRKLGAAEGGSIFRTGDSASARVGVMGSGGTMTQDLTDEVRKRMRVGAAEGGLAAHITSKHQ